VLFRLSRSKEIAPNFEERPPFHVLNGDYLIFADNSAARSGDQDCRHSAEGRGGRRKRRREESRNETTEHFQLADDPWLNLNSIRALVDQVQTLRELKLEKRGALNEAR